MAEPVAYGLIGDPSLTRAAMIPVGRRTYTDPGDDITEELGGLEFATPGLLHDPLMGMASTGAMLMGDMPVNPNVMTQTMLDAPLVGGLLGAATGAAPKGTLLGANVFHGGPHRFAPEPDFPHGRPRLDKIGTGEGNQAYGYGFYSADAPGVAKSYADALGGKVLEASDGSILHSSDIPLDMMYASMEMGAAKTIDEAISNLSKSGKFGDEVKYLSELRDKGYQMKPGTLYKLDIPDADVAKYLDYDKPLSEQPKSVREALANMVSVSAADRKQITKEIKALQARLNDPWVRRSGGAEMSNKLRDEIQELKAVLLDDSLTGGEFYKGVVTGLGGRKDASEALRDIGIPGLKYFDQGSRAGGEGTRNYVTWDQDVLDRSKMLERDGVTLGANKAPTAALPGLLGKVLDKRAEQMLLPPAERLQPSGRGVMDLSPEAYVRDARQFSDDLMSDIPRQVAGKALPKAGRSQVIVDNMDDIATVLADRARSQMGTETQYFYHTGPIYEAARKAGLSKKEAGNFMRDFADAYAATSPRTPTEPNLRSASLVMAKDAAGIPFDTVVGPNAGRGLNETGYPMMIQEKGDISSKGKPATQTGIHKLLLQELQRSGKINKDTNPKPATFARNVEGNLSAPTIDTHAIRGALDALNELQPGAIPKDFIKPKFRKQYAEDPSSFNAATMVADTLESAQVGGTKKQVEYAPFADLYKLMADKLGVSPAEAQSMGWFGSGAKTGLASEAKSVARLIDERIDVTAQALGVTPKEAARMFFRREIPLMANPATAALPGLLQDRNQPKQAGEPTEFVTDKGRPVYRTPEGELVSEQSITLKIGDAYLNFPSIQDGVRYGKADLRKMFLSGQIKPTSTHKTVDGANKAARKRSMGMKLIRRGNIDQRGVMSRTPRKPDEFPIFGLLGQRLYTATAPDGSI